jgi:hypothetical protein
VWLNSVPVPADSMKSQAKSWQRGQTGMGGCRSDRQPQQR